MIKKRYPVSLAVCLFSRIILCHAGHLPGDTLIHQKQDSVRNASSIPVLFGRQKNAELLQSVSSISYDDIRYAPVTTTENSLYGKLAGLYLIAATGEPGSDGATMSLRGQTPLVVVDGVQRSILSIDPEQIASVTVLKDALTTAMYGMRGSPGVVLVNTKRGWAGPRRISFTAQTARQEFLKPPKFLHAYDYARLYNEALANDGKPAAYTDADLEAWRSGSDPFGHPDVDWYNKVLKDQAAMQRYNLNIGGGNRTSRYFVDLDYLNQQGYFITDSKNTYPTNNYYKRYIFRSNVDVDLTSTTHLGLNVFGRIRNGNEPGAGTDNIYSSILTTPNNAYPMLNYDGSLGGNTQYSNNIYGQVLRSGYRPTYNRNLLVDVSLRQDLDALVKGLYVKGLVSFNSYYEESINRQKSFAVYNVQVNGGDTAISQIGTNGTQSNSSTISSTTRQAYMEFAAGYARSFGPHGLDVLVLVNRDNYTGGSTQLPLNNYGVSARIQYNYAHKYLLEADMGYTALNRYAAGRRWGYFPAIGIGWNMGDEDWFKAAMPLVSTLKWRATYGRTGNNTGIGYYSYLQYYTTGNTYPMGEPVTSYNTIMENTLANPQVTWEKAGKLNIGVDVGLKNDRLLFTAEYFRNRYSNLLMQRGMNASTVIGATLPVENLGTNDYCGFEFSATGQARIGALQLTATANATIQQSKVVAMDEVTRKYPWQRRTGQRVGQPFGLEADGFFQSPEEISKSPKVEGYNPVPGDLKYKDLNNDGIINVFDEHAIGSKQPLVFYGATVTAGFKGLDLTMVWQGVANRDVWLTGYNTWEFQNNGMGQAMEHHLDRWTPATAATATYPRLTVGANPNNHRNSTFWLKNGRYIRLKNIELGYSLPARWLTPLRLRSLRAFVNANNLLTITPLKRVDPEVYSGGYPNQRVMNAGINIQL